jgi:hypothetical protein
MVAVAVALPPGPLAVSVYVVVAVGLTLTVPAHATGPTPLSIEQFEASLMPLHERTADCPLVMLDGLAPNAPMVAAGGALTVNVRPALVPPAVFTVTL